MACNRQLEFGDYQTPPALAALICRTLLRLGIQARSIIEPTCGTGTLLSEALQAFPGVSQGLGVDILPRYVALTQARVSQSLGARPANRRPQISLCQADFFEIDWQERFRALRAPQLVIGNPPWINMARMSVVGGSNRPARTGAAGWGGIERGIEAITGKSNFDLGESMLLTLFRALEGRAATLAMLCKVTTARRVLHHVWQASPLRPWAAIFRIDSQASFGAAVDACLLVARFGDRGSPPLCRDFSSLEAKTPSSQFGLVDRRLVADLQAYRRAQELMHPGQRVWRSGIKHDCARVFELRRRGNQLQNGFGQMVTVEESCVFPLLKGGHLMRRQLQADRCLLVTQRRVGQDTERLAARASRTWQYLQQHASLLDQRKSSIYRGRSRFAMFGIGPYTFTRWKVAISGLSKQLSFVPVGPFRGKPVVFDDTCYLLPCRNKDEALRKWNLLQQPLAVDLFTSLIFWDAKRPITAEILNRLDLDRFQERTRNKRPQR